MRRFLPMIILAAACAPTTQPASPAPEAPSAENAGERHPEILWVRTAAEYRALTLQTYRTATNVIRRKAAELEPGTWAVVMDADETVLDNSEFEARIAERGQPFEESLWDDWVMEEAAGSVPGAVAFIDEIQDLGGRIAIVTNRDERLCPATRRNLAALGIRPAVVLCETDTGEKEHRFQMVEAGTASDTLPPLQIMAWVGDNIGDFPGLDQGDRDAILGTFQLFGDRYFVLPNPMYGSWMVNEWR